LYYTSYKKRGFGLSFFVPYFADARIYRLGKNRKNMNRERFNQKYGTSWATKDEMERKWKVYLREQEEMRMLYEAAMKSSSSAPPGIAGGGGAGQPNPRAIVVSAQDVLVDYVDSVTDEVKFFVANYDSFAFSDEIRTGYTSAELAGGPYDEELVAGRGWIVSLTLAIDNAEVFYFIDAGGNLVETVDTGGSANNYSSEQGIVSFLSYTDPRTGKVTLKWWGGDTVYTQTFDNVADSYVYFDTTSGDDCTVDGTTTIYYDDTVLNKQRTYLINAYTGTVTEITETLEHPTFDYESLALHGIGNFLIAEFFSFRTESAEASYNIGDSFLTLSAPNPNIFVGDEITGPNIATGTVVIEIEGTTVSLSLPVNGTEVDQGIATNSSRFELTRIINTDGTYTDYDFGQYNAWDFNERAIFGTNKVAYLLYTQTDQLPWTLVTYSHSESVWYSAQIDKIKYPNFRMDWYNIDPFSDYYNSPAATESFNFIAYDTESTDDKMWRYSPIKFYWNNATTAEIYTYEPTIGITDFQNLSTTAGAYTEGPYTGIASTTEGPGSGATFDITVDSNGDVTVLTINERGEGYYIGEVLTIAGTAIGGESPSEDITLTVNQLQYYSVADPFSAPETMPALHYVSAVDSNDVEILTLKQDGTTSTYTTPTLYADTGTYFNVTALGNEYTLFSHYDNSREGDIQFFGAWSNADGAFTDNDNNIWVSTNNSWTSNYDTFFMSDATGDLTWYFNSSMGNLDQTIQAIEGAPAYNNSVEADYNNGGDYIDFHQTGTTLLVMPDDTAYILSSNYTSPAQVDFSETIDVSRLNANYYYNLAQNGLSEYVVDVYDLEGSLVNTVETEFGSYDNFEVYGNRVWLTQVDGTSVTFWMLSPSGYQTKTINSNSFDYSFNSWRWWN